jgi:hypothetical protein
MVALPVLVAAGHFPQFTANDPDARDFPLDFDLTLNNTRIALKRQVRCGPADGACCRWWPDCGPLAS